MTDQPQVERLSLEKSASHLLEECRMVLPGVQALFGFQFIAVFNQTFGEKVSPAMQHVHLAALVCTAFAAAMVMAPAALHRQTQPRSVSEQFVRVSSRLLMWSMAPLAVGTSADVYIVAYVVSHRDAVAAAATIIVLAAFVGFWVVLPRRVGRLKPPE